MRYAVTGSGPWVTLSHSLACRLEMWDGNPGQPQEREASVSS